MWFDCKFNSNLYEILKLLLIPQENDGSDEFIHVGFTWLGTLHYDPPEQRPKRSLNGWVLGKAEMGVGQRPQRTRVVGSSLFQLPWGTCMGVSINGGIPKSSCLIRCSLINHQFGGPPPPFTDTPICLFTCALASWLSAQFDLEVQNAETNEDPEVLERFQLEAIQCYVHATKAHALD